jgi:hypothetical protein
MAQRPRLVAAHRRCLFAKNGVNGCACDRQLLTVCVRKLWGGGGALASSAGARHARPLRRLETPSAAAPVAAQPPPSSAHARAPTPLAHSPTTPLPPGPPPTSRDGVVGAHCLCRQCEAQHTRGLWWVATSLQPSDSSPTKSRAGLSRLTARGPKTQHPEAVNTDRGSVRGVCGHPTSLLLPLPDLIPVSWP